MSPRPDDPETAKTLETTRGAPVDVPLVLPDGVSLHARLWCPPEGRGPWPALLMRQPYGHAIASTVTYAHPSWWASHGFLVVVQDVRGQGASGGTFEGFAQERADTSATLTWLRNLAACNGRVGLYGFSYQGFTQLVAEPDSDPPDCLAPAMTGLNERDHWSCEGGAHWWHLGLGWGLQLAGLQARRRGDAEAWRCIRACLEDNRHCRDGLSLLQRHDADGMALRWLESRADNDDAWTIHTTPESWLRRPMLLTGGWWDPHLRGVLDLYQQSRAAGGDPDLVIGPATHLQWWPEAQRLHLNFFQRHLLQGQGDNNTPSPPNPGMGTAALWDQCAGSWSEQEIHECRGGDWRLQGSSLACHDPDNGRLIPVDAMSTTAPQPQDGRLVIVHDPWRAVPAVGGHLSPSAGPCDRRAIDARGDVATFTSAPLMSPLKLRGRPHLRLEAWADQPGFDLCVALSVCPAGTAQVNQLSTGIRRVIGDQCRQASPYDVELQGLEAQLNVGDRLRVSVAGACWPAIAINPGTGDHRCGPPSISCRVISINLNLLDAGLHFSPLVDAPES